MVSTWITKLVVHAEDVSFLVKYASHYIDANDAQFAANDEVRKAA